MIEFQTKEERKEERQKVLELVAKTSPDHTKMIPVKVDEKLILYFNKGTSKDKIKKAVEKHKKKEYLTHSTKKLFTNIENRDEIETMNTKSSTGSYTEWDN